MSGATPASTVRQRGAPATFYGPWIEQWLRNSVSEAATGCEGADRTMTQYQTLQAESNFQDIESLKTFWHLQIAATHISGLYNWRILFTTLGLGIIGGHFLCLRPPLRAQPSSMGASCDRAAEKKEAVERTKFSAATAWMSTGTEADLGGWFINFIMDIYSISIYIYIIYIYIQYIYCWGTKSGEKWSILRLSI